mgnify:CR=1 FL=1
MPYVTRPALGGQVFFRVLVQHLGLHTQLIPRTLQEVVGQAGDIFTALSQPGNMDTDYIEAVEQILTEVPILDQPLQILVSGCNNANIHMDRSGTTNAIKLALLQYPQQASLRFQRHVTDFIEEQGATVCQFEASCPGGDRAGERARFVTEKLALQQGLGKRGAVHLDERAVPTLGQEVELRRHELLAGPTLADDEHGTGADGLDEVDGLDEEGWSRPPARYRPGRGGFDPEAAAARNAALVAVDEVHDSAVRVLTAFDEPDPAQRKDVVWHAVDDFRGSVKRTVRMAPLSVGGLLRSRLFAESTVVLTSATLTVGGSFDGLAVNWGLPAENSARSETAMSSGAEPPSDTASIHWNSLDVGSPFDHAKAGILYVAEHLPPPGRDGLSPLYLDEIEALVGAAGGRTLGLFSSMRAAKTAAEAMRERLDTPVLCQGDDATGALVTKFAEDEATSLFGTLSLWQGVDVPGPSLSLVILDRIPFPRPDDPLLVARQQAVQSRGGNGFLSVAANHAALLLAQGVGRLLRSVNDRGVVAMLDSRLATARYGGYLRASLPPFWETSDPEVVRRALTRLAER